MVLDGRLRTTICDTRSCSLFFVVERSDDPNECNMAQHYSSVSITTAVDFPATPKRTFEKTLEPEGVPQIPYVMNTKVELGHQRELLLGRARSGRF